MSDLVAPILAEVLDESDTFWCFVGLMQNTIFVSSPRDEDMERQLVRHEACVCMCMCRCACVGMHVSVPVYIQVCVFTSVCTHVCVCLCIGGLRGRTLPPVATRGLDGEMQL